MTKIFVGAANDITYQNCTAVNCQVGFDTWFHTNSQWIDIKVAHNCKDVLIEPGAQRTYTCNRCSECPGGLTTTLTNIASNNQVATPTRARSCTCPK